MQPSSEHSKAGQIKLLIQMMGGINNCVIYFCSCSSCVTCQPMCLGFFVCLHLVLNFQSWPTSLILIGEHSLLEAKREREVRQCCLSHEGRKSFDFCACTHTGIRTDTEALQGLHTAYYKLTNLKQVTVQIQGVSVKFSCMFTVNLGLFAQPSFPSTFSKTHIPFKIL